MSETFILTPSSYSCTEYVQIDNADNMLSSTSSSTYAEFYNTQSTSAGQKVYLYFDLSELPSMLSVDSYSFKLAFGVSSAQSSWYNTAYLYAISRSYSDYYSTNYVGKNIYTFDNRYQYTWNDIISETASGYPRIEMGSGLPTQKICRVYGAELIVTGEPAADHGIFNLILPRG